MNERRKKAFEGAVMMRGERTLPAYKRRNAELG